MKKTPQVPALPGMTPLGLPLVDATTPVTTRADGNFKRTAIVITPGDSEHGSIDIVGPHGELLARINTFAFRASSGEINRVIIDTIDAGERFEKHTAVTFEPKDGRKFTKTGTLVSADFSSEE